MAADGGLSYKETNKVNSQVLCKRDMSVVDPGVIAGANNHLAGVVAPRYSTLS